MLKKPITYTDFNDNVRTDTCYFHLSKAELMEMNFSVEGGMEAAFKRIVKNDDGGGFIALLKDFILKAYGEKSDDGKTFVKVRNGHRLSEDFEQTPMYSELFMSLISDENEAINFIKQLLPKDLSDQIDAKMIEDKKAELLEA